ncbi:hypothetical protein EGM70_00585 [Enterobacteriaceae bacterium 89]|nr:hypothetical protein [Enterobacteriaceae bacterium 89]
MPRTSQTDTLYFHLCEIKLTKIVTNLLVFFLPVFITLFCLVRWTEINQGKYRYLVRDFWTHMDLVLA